MTSRTIDRDASDSNKGLRLQKLRAIEILLQESARNDSIQTYATIEAHGDVSCTSATPQFTSTYSEENKNYSDARLSLMSAPVLNTFVNFIDTWIQWQYSPSLRFGFYSTADISKENNTSRTKALGITLPDKPVLELLQSPDSSLVGPVKLAVLAEYETQYSKRSGGHLQELRIWNDTTWLTLLRLIHWSFGSADHDDTEKRVLAAIKRSPFHNSHHIGREPLLLAALLDLVEKKHLASDYAQKFVHAESVRLAFQDVAATPTPLLDPTWSIWSGLPPPTDRRNIEEKLRERCPSVALRVVEKYQRKAAAAHAELSYFSHDRTVQALQYQVYDECVDQLSTLSQAGELSEDTLEATIERLVAAAVTRVRERSKSYGYQLHNDVTIRGIVLALVDRCFLSLNGAVP